MKKRILHALALLTAASLALVPADAATYYTTNVLNDAPLLYWSFDEDDGNAIQLAPLSRAPITTENDLVPMLGAGRVVHSEAGGLAKLGRAADFNGGNFYQATALLADRVELSPPWVVEFWIQATGANADNRADYLINFGNSFGGDNAPAFIYDFEPDTLEVFGGGAGRTANSPELNDNNWHHVLWAYYGDGSSGVANRLELYMDGVLFGDVRDTFARGIKLNQGLLVGAATAAGVNGFEGRLDEFAIYDLSGELDEWGVSAKVDQLAVDHYLEGTQETGNSYFDVVMSGSPLLYWNFDEESGPARQLVATVLPPLNNDQNQLYSEGGGRVMHEIAGSGLDLGNAAELNGAGMYRADDLEVGFATLPAPWAVEFWMQVQGDNSALRQDYFLNFGANPDNSPAFIYDYNQDQLELYNRGPRTQNGPVIGDQNWHHVLWVFYGDGTVGVADRMEAFIDGANLGRNVRGNYSSALQLTDRLLVGAALPGGVGGFEGRMDEVAIYDLRALTSEAAVSDKVTQMALKHYLAGFGPPSEAAITIQQQPGDVTAQRGETATFSVAATVAGAPADSLTYQWMKNNVAIAGATEASYTTPVLLLGDVGTNLFSVRIGTVGGVFVISREAALGVPAPAFEATYYASQVAQDGALLYWSFDEAQGGALQRSPLGVPTVGAANDLVSVAGAGRVSVMDVGGPEKLGRAADLNGANFFQASALNAGRASINPPWVVEFWMQAAGDNTGNRADYMINFGTYPGGDNAPAFIYDFEPDALEVYAGGAGRTGGSPALNDSDWHHVVWAYYGDGASGGANRLELYVDGALFGDVRDTFSRGIKLNQGLLVGAATPAGADGFEGRLDEFAVYDLSGAGDEAGVAARVASLVNAHRNAALNPDEPDYTSAVLADQPVLYWNFEEEEGNAIQRAPVTLPAPNPANNELLPQLGATRVAHSEIGSGLTLGNAADLNGVSYFQAVDLDTGLGLVSAPWAVEFWFQIQGDNSMQREDYLINFGTYPGGDNSPAFIFDYKPDQFEVFGGAAGRTDNGPTIADNEWHHLLWVYYGDGATGVGNRLEAWVDGVTAGDVRSTFARGIKVSEGLLVGAAIPGGSGGFEGQIGRASCRERV